MAETRRYYSLSMAGAADAKKTIRVNNPNFTKTVNDLRSATFNILESSVFALKNGGMLTAVKKLEKVMVTREKLF